MLVALLGGAAGAVGLTRHSRGNTIPGVATALMPPLCTAGYGLPTAPMLLRKVRVEHPSIRQLGLGRLVRPAADSLRADTTVVVSMRTSRPLPAQERQCLRQWLPLRAGGKRAVELLLNPAPGK
ncbi:hypothetical protein GCM10022408_11680 [Hymenobacter fastidiosus]|uniref:DUF4131 domain-containing protein n=1 Tax=Hymenobacter fastidiosus TaxID=486264 RepID=A0ABP7RTH4_9BACT